MNCALCGSEFKNASGLAGHKQLAHQAQEVSEDRLTALEQRFGELIEVLGASSAKGEEMEGADRAVSVKDLKIRDLDHELAAAKATVADLREKLTATERSHDRLGPLLVHAKDGSCTNCNADLREHNAAVIKTALKNIDPKVVQEIAIAAGVVPQTIRVQIPD